MSKLYYCKECKRILKSESEFGCCQGENINELEVGTSVNVIGTKIKGNVYKIKGEIVTLTIKEEGGNKFLKEFEFEKLRKIL